MSDRDKNNAGINNSIIVIDDDEAFCQTLCRTLTRRGFKTYQAHNAKKALAVVTKYQPALAVLDLRLGEDSGLQLIKPLLEESPQLRVVVLTGFASLTTAVQAVKMGAINYLAKPVNADAILLALTGDEGENEEVAVVMEPTPLKQLEWEHIQRVLDENNGNVSATARQLDMHRRTLQRKLQKRPG